MVGALNFFSHDPAALLVAVTPLHGPAPRAAMQMKGLVAQKLIDGCLGARLGVNPFHDHCAIKIDVVFRRHRARHHN